MSPNALFLWLRQRTLRTKVTAASVLFVLIAAVIGALNVASVHQAIKKEKLLKLRQLVEVANTVIQVHFDEYASGKTSEAAAQQNALNAINQLRYSGNNYFWIHDLHTPFPRMVLHPAIPELAGKILDDPAFNCATSEQLGLYGDIQPTDGHKNLFVAFNDVVRQARHGYVTYDWPKPLPDGGVTHIPYPKLSYVRLFEPWGWVVGSGIYMDDVNNTLLRQIGLNILAWAILLTAGISFVFIIHRALTPLSNAAAELNRMIEERSPLHPLTVEQADEVGVLVSSFNRLQNQLAEESRALQESRALLIEAQAMAQLGHLVFDFEHQHWDSSEILNRIFGIPADYPRDLPALLALCHPDDALVLGQYLSRDTNEANDANGLPEAFDQEFRIYRADNGALCYLHGRGKRGGASGNTLFLALQDITMAKAHQYKLEHLAHFDPLTGVPNRALLADRMAQALAQTRRQNTMMAVCYLDLDGFKPVNDQHGHKVGDMLLIEMARRMNQCIRAGDTVARIGGDEFIILLLRLDEPAECEHAIQRILTDIAQPFEVENLSICVSVSIGVTLFPQDASNGETLLRHADQALYAAKQSGKNQFCFFNPAAQGIETQSQFDKNNNTDTKTEAC